MGAVWFWMLATLSCALLAACLLIPPWHQRRQLAQAVTAADQQLAAMKAEWAEQREMAEALQVDPAATEWALVEELNYARPGELALRAPQALPELAMAVPKGADQLRPHLRAALAWADRQIVPVILQRRPRQLLLALAAVTLLAAMILFDPDHYLKPARRRGRTPNRAGR